MVFYIGKQYMKTLKKICIKVQRMPISSFVGWISSFPVMPEMSSLGAFFGKRSSLLFWQKGNFIFVGKRNTTFTNTQKTSYFHAFYEKHHLSFSVGKKISYFWEKEMPSFLVIQERSYSSVIFLERSSFQNIWNKNMVFRAVY